MRTLRIVTFGTAAAMWLWLTACTVEAMIGVWYIRGFIPTVLLPPLVWMALFVFLSIPVVFTFSENNVDAAAFRLAIVMVVTFMITTINFGADRLPRPDITVREGSFLYASWWHEDGRRVGYQRNLASGEETLALFPSGLIPARPTDELVEVTSMDGKVCLHWGGDKRCFNSELFVISLLDDKARQHFFPFETRWISRIVEEGRRRVSAL